MRLASSPNVSDLFDGRAIFAPQLRQQVEPFLHLRLPPWIRRHILLIGAHGGRDIFGEIERLLQFAHLLAQAVIQPQQVAEGALRRCQHIQRAACLACLVTC